MPTSTQPTLQVFYDGVCPLCRREVGHYRKKDIHHRIDWIDIAGAGFDAAAYGLDPARITQVMHARTPEGTLYTEVRAFIQIWKALPPTLFSIMMRLLLKIPGMLPFAGIFYRLFARNRYRLTGRCTPNSCRIS
jgi:predicted DCC family thiol-disulfide oxidoreductase YuxK